MNWDQIEIKWAAMARRVRSDLPQTPRWVPDDLPALPPGDLPEPPQPKDVRVSDR